MKIYKHNKYNYVTIVEIPKKEITKIDFELCNQPKETLESFYNRQPVKPDIVINGGIFNLKDGATYFNYIDDNKTVSGWHWYTTGMGVVNGELKYGELSSEKWTDFVSAYPPLIDNGNAVEINYATDINYTTRRSILAYDANNIYLIAVETPGMVFSTMQKMLLEMRVTHAINLDGGGSTKILHRGESITSATSYNRPVDNVLAIYLKRIYRVQVGAFTKEPYAIALRDKLRALPDSIGAGYKNAYVRKIGNYYKVQVGAFSKEENAYRVLTDLKCHGYNGFITSD